MYMYIVCLCLYMYISYINEDIHRLLTYHHHPPRVSLSLIHPVCPHYTQTMAPVLCPICPMSYLSYLSCVLSALRGGCDHMTSRDTTCDTSVNKILSAALSGGVFRWLQIAGQSAFSHTIQVL